MYIETIHHTKMKGQSKTNQYGVGTPGCLLLCHRVFHQPSTKQKYLRTKDNTVGRTLALHETDLGLSPASHRIAVHCQE